MKPKQTNVCTLRVNRARILWILYITLLNIQRKYWNLATSMCEEFFVFFFVNIYIYIYCIIVIIFNLFSSWQIQKNYNSCGFYVMFEEKPILAAHKTKQHNGNLNDIWHSSEELLFCSAFIYIKKKARRAYLTSKRKCDFWPLRGKFNKRLRGTFCVIWHFPGAYFILQLLHDLRSQTLISSPEQVHSYK